MKSIVESFKKWETYHTALALLCVIIGLAFWKVSILLFIVILLTLVIVHEFGHFIAAKLTGMRVDEFAFGFPPRLFAWKKGETTYAINALPVGGYVSIWGENGEPNDEAKHHPRAFGNRPKWQQLVVLLAGVFMNMVLALVLFIGLSFGSTQMSPTDPVYGHRVKNVSMYVYDSIPNSPAYLAGLIPGSVITGMQSGGMIAPLTSATGTLAFIGAHQNDSFKISFIRPDGTKSTTTIAAVYGILPEKKALGISIEAIGTVRTTPVEAVKIGFTKTYDMTMLTLGGLKDLATSFRGEGNVLDSIAGPIGLVQVVGQNSSFGIAALLWLTAVLSINLAIFNALPIPALDGGRVVVVVLEAITRRRIPFTYYSWANIIGFSALMLLLFVVTVHDIIRIFA